MKRTALGLASVLALALAAPASAGGVSGVSVTVRCHSNPEKVTIRNNRGSSIVIDKVGSTYQPRSGEPWAVYRTLAAGKSVTYSFGTANGPHKLTNQFIFADHPREEAKVVTNLGTIKRDC